MNDRLIEVMQMKELSYMFYKALSKLTGKKEVLNNYFRKSGMKIGKNCTICCNIMTEEPELVSIGDNVTISVNVKFVTHDNSFAKIDKYHSNLFGYYI